MILPVLIMCFYKYNTIGLQTCYMSVNHVCVDPNFIPEQITLIVHSTLNMMIFNNNNNNNNKVNHDRHL